MRKRGDGGGRNKRGRSKRCKKCRAMMKVRDAEAREVEVGLVVFFDYILFYSLYVVLVVEFIVPFYNFNFSHMILLV